MLESSFTGHSTRLSTWPEVGLAIPSSWKRYIANRAEYIPFCPQQNGGDFVQGRTVFQIKIKPPIEIYWLGDFLEAPSDFL